MKNIYFNSGLPVERYYKFVKEDELLISCLIPKDERCIRNIFDEFNPDMILKEFSTYANEEIQFDFITADEHEKAMDEIKKRIEHFENIDRICQNRKEIKRLGSTLKVSPTRRTSDVNDQELHIAAQILQLSPKEEQYYLRCLKIVFSPARASRILNRIIENV